MCGPTSGWCKVALFVLIIGVALHIAGWATNNWMTYDTTNSVIEMDIGLWRMVTCNTGTCTDSTVASSYETDSFNAVRGMETVTFCLAVFTAILLIIYMCADMARRQMVAAVIMTLCYIAGVCSFIGMVIFIATIPSPFVVSWSLGLTVIAMTLILIAGTLMIPDAFDPYYDEDDDYFGRRRDLVSPMSIGANRGRGGVVSRGIEPVSYKGALEQSRWRSY